MDNLRLFALINGYYECLEHAHQIVSVNMACQIVSFWFLVSGMAIILQKIFFCCAIVLRGIRTLVLSLLYSIWLFRDKSFCFGSLIVSGIAIILLKRFFCCAIVLRGIRTLVLSFLYSIWLFRDKSFCFGSLIVSGIAIILLKRFFCCAIVLHFSAFIIPSTCNVIGI